MTSPKSNRLASKSGDVRMTERRERRVAIVTGGASGIGKACAERLAEQGITVVVTDIQDGNGVVEAISRTGGAARYLRHDVASEADWAQVTQTVLEEFGRIDILVNNAGICRRRALLDMTLDEFRQVYAVNVDGVFLGMKHVVPAMRAQKSGTIINMSSVAGLKGIPEMSAYSSSKGAVRLITKAIALEHAKDGIRVNSLHPGMIDTPIMDDLVGATGADRSAAVTAWSEQTVPTGETGQPDDVAGAVLWLVSDHSSYVNGAEIVVDGGMSLL